MRRRAGASAAAAAAAVSVAPAVGRRWHSSPMRSLWLLGALLLSSSSLFLSFASAQFTPDFSSSAEAHPGATGGSATGTGADPIYNNGGFDTSSTGAIFGMSQLPDYPPYQVNYTAGQCQYVPKWPGPRCPASFECISDELSTVAKPDDGRFTLTYRQEQCVFCFVTEFCTQAQKDACENLDIFQDSDTIEVVNNTAGVGYCHPCKEGQYCPSDPTTGAQASNPFGLAIVNLCTEGFYCPTPAEQVPCREGFWCPPGTKFPFACTVTGTYCDVGSTSASNLCPGGYYCPNPQTKILCPRGYFCKKGSTQPRKCQALASCPPGSAAALIVWQGILEVCALYLAMGLLYWAVVYVQKRRRKKELKLIAQRTEGKEVVELLKSLKTFQALEVREGMTPRQMAYNEANLAHEMHMAHGAGGGGGSRNASPAGGGGLRQHSSGAGGVGPKPNVLAALDAAAGGLVVARTAGDDIALVRKAGEPGADVVAQAEAAETGAPELNKGQLANNTTNNNKSSASSRRGSKDHELEPVVVGVFSNPHRASGPEGGDAAAFAAELKEAREFQRAHPTLSKITGITGMSDETSLTRRPRIEVIMPPEDEHDKAEAAAAIQAKDPSATLEEEANHPAPAATRPGTVRKYLPASVHVLTDEDAPGLGASIAAAYAVPAASAAAANGDMANGSVAPGAAGGHSHAHGDGPCLDSSCEVLNPCNNDECNDNNAECNDDGSDSDDDDDHDDFEGFDPVPVPVTLSFERLGLKLKNGVQLLSGVSGVFPHSRLTALMGPSGCGKSTFLNVLCGKATYGEQTGCIKVNGVATTIASLRSITGFVPQDDVMHGDLTCYENLYYNAMLRLPRGMPFNQKKQIVYDTIRMLGLEAVQHSVVGVPEARGISGGQRKRVSIGLEVSACPTICFMDEPTSGLDATASLEVISALRDLTTLGMSIVTVIHQPRFSIVELFHAMLLLGKGGRTVFLGNSEQALNYFSDLGFHMPQNENPADWFLDIISGEVRREGDPDFQPSDLFELWETTGEWVREGKPEPPSSAPNRSESAVVARSSDNGLEDYHITSRSGRTGGGGGYGGGASDAYPDPAATMGPDIHFETPEEAEASMMMNQMRSPAASDYGAAGANLFQRQGSTQRFVPPALIVTPSHYHHYQQQQRQNGAFVNPLSTRWMNESSAPPTTRPGHHYHHSQPQQLQQMQQQQQQQQPLQRFSTMNGTGGGSNYASPNAVRLPPAGGIEHRSQTAGAAGAQSVGGWEHDMYPSNYYYNNYNTTNPHSVRMYPYNAGANGNTAAMSNAHRRTRSLYNAMSAYRAGIKDASELPLPKHRELLNKFGKEGIGKLVHDYREAQLAAKHKHERDYRERGERGERERGDKDKDHHHRGESTHKDKDKDKEHQHHHFNPFSARHHTDGHSPVASSAKPAPVSTAPTPHPSTTTAAAAAAGSKSPDVRDLRNRMLHQSASARRLNMLFERQPSVRNLGAQSRGALMRTGSMHQLQNPYYGPYGPSASALAASARASQNPYHHAHFAAMMSPASSVRSGGGGGAAGINGMRTPMHTNGGGAYWRDPRQRSSGSPPADYYSSAAPYDSTSAGPGVVGGMDWPGVAKLRSPIVVVGNTNSHSDSVRSPVVPRSVASSPGSQLRSPVGGIAAVPGAEQSSASASSSSSSSTLRQHPSAGTSVALGGIEEEDELSPPRQAGVATTGSAAASRRVPLGGAPSTRSPSEEEDSASLPVKFHNEDDEGAQAFSQAAGKILSNGTTSASSQQEQQQSALRSSSLPMQSSFGGPALSEIPQERGTSDGASAVVAGVEPSTSRKGKRLPPHLKQVPVGGAAVVVDNAADDENSAQKEEAEEQSSRQHRFKYHQHSPSSSSELGDEGARLAAALSLQADKLQLPLGDMAVTAAALDQLEAENELVRAIDAAVEAHKCDADVAAGMDVPASSAEPHPSDPNFVAVMPGKENGHSSKNLNGKGNGKAHLNKDASLTDKDTKTKKKTKSDVEMTEMSGPDAKAKPDAVAVPMDHESGAQQLPPCRAVPFIPIQFLYLLERQCLKLLRGVNHILFDMVLTTAVGLAIGLIFGGVWSLNAYGNISVLGVLSLGVLSCVSALKMFGSDRIVFWRESSAGISVIAYWMAVTLIHLPFTLIFSFLFVAPYYNLILPDVSFQSTWFVFIGVHFACSGGGMLLSVAFVPLTALLSGVMLPLIIGGFLNGVSPAIVDMSSTLRFFADLSYSRYGVEALMLQEFGAQPDYAQPLVDKINAGIGFQITQLEFAIGMLFVIGAVLRAATLIALFALNRDKRV